MALQGKYASAEGLKPITEAEREQCAKYTDAFYLADHEDDVRICPPPSTDKTATDVLCRP
jgi:hypothetical protein